MSLHQPDDETDNCGMAQATAEGRIEGLPDNEVAEYATHQQGGERPVTVKQRTEEGYACCQPQVTDNAVTMEELDRQRCCEQVNANEYE